MDFTAIADALAVAQPIEAERVPVVPGRCVHVDGDMLAYWAGGGPDTSVSTSRNILLAKVAAFAVACGAERSQLHLTADGSTKGDRYLAATMKPYQGKRSGGKPKNWGYLRQYMLEDTGSKPFTTKNWFDREADDGFGYISTCLPNDVIATRDKDMRMLPGYHLDWTTNTLVYVPRDAYCVEACDVVYGLKWFLLQMLHGDSVDNIPGLHTHPNYKRGVGDAAANKILAGTTTWAQGYAAATTAYREQYAEDWADRWAEQASLLWMRRDKGAHLLDWLLYLPEGMDPRELTDAGDRLFARVQELKEEARCLSD